MCGRNAEEASFRVDGVQTAVRAEFHPSNIVADGLHLPTGNGRDHHGQVGLPAGAGEGGGHVDFLAFRVGDAQDEHMFGQPALLAGDG